MEDEDGACVSAMATSDGWFEEQPMARTFNQPLRFEPVFRRYLWGGRRLATVLGKPLGEGDDYAESWEVVDHGEDQSVVAEGPHAGVTLGTLMREDREALLGRHAGLAGGFPLLVKFLDAQRTLSVQVHPDDTAAAELEPPDLGKTEAWVVLAAEPGSKIYAGLKRGFDRAALEREVRRGTCELCLHAFEPEVGDCVFVPAGTVHALGAGLLVCEIQQSSDTTYRLFDWNRVGADGQPRELHIEQGLEAIDFARGPVGAQEAVATERPQVERLVSCEKFVIDRCRLSEPESMGGDGRFHVMVVLEGELAFEGGDAPYRKGETCLIPAAMEAGRVVEVGEGVTTYLDAYLP